MASSSPTLVILLCLLALISLHLRPAKAHDDTHDSKHDLRMEKAAIVAARSLNITFLPMPNGTRAPFMTGLKWGCPCNGPNGLSCGCDITGCGCSHMPIVQPPWECPGDSRCGCDHSGCGCSPPPDYGCPPDVGFCQYYPNNFYCRILTQGVGNTSSINGGSSEAEDQLEFNLK